MRLLKNIILLVMAACLTAGCFYLIDTCGNHGTEGLSAEVAVTSDLTKRIYALEEAVPSDDLERLGDYETGLDKEIVSYLKAHGGGKYTNSEGETTYVPSSSGGGYYSGGGDYYDDGYNDWSGGDSSGGGSDDSWDLYIDDTEYNICHVCGTEYTGTGGCPNPNCEAYHPGEF